MSRIRFRRDHTRFVRRGNRNITALELGPRRCVARANAVAFVATFLKFDNRECVERNRYTTARLLSSLSDLRGLSREEDIVVDARSRNNTVRCSEATCDDRSCYHDTFFFLFFFFRKTETSTILFASFPAPPSTLDRRAAVTRRTRGSVDRQLYTYKKKSKNNKLTSLFVAKNKTISLFVEQRQYDWDPAATICFSEHLSDISHTRVHILYPTLRRSRISTVFVDPSCPSHVETSV